MKHLLKHGRTVMASCLALLFVMLSVSAFAVSYPYETTSMDDVNLRKYANTTSTVLKKIQAGDTVKILAVSGSFYKVEFQGKTGYAKKMYIDGTSPDPDPTVAPDEQCEPLTAVKGYPYDTVVISRVKLRKTAKSTGEVIRMLPVGTAVRVLGDAGNGFSRVKVDGKTGYVLTTHICYAVFSTAASSTPAPTATPKPGSEKYSELKTGSSGDAVKALQNALAELGYMNSSEVDGKYGSVTASALKTFQKRNGLTVDGVASAELQLLLYEGTPKDYKGYRQYVKTCAAVQGALIREGSVGEAVKKAQARLYVLGYYQADANGTCDAATVAAILLFEGKNGLNCDGQLDAADQAVMNSASAIKASDAAEATTTETPRLSATLRLNSKGEDVKRVQERLTELGYYTGAVSGTYNAATAAAVKAFQKMNSLEQDGVTGAITYTVLFGKKALAASGASADTVVKEYEQITQENCVTIKAGSTGDAVFRLQERLQELGYYTSRLDGLYLTEDIAAVQAFQKANGLVVDGKAGYQTQTLLYSSSAKANPNDSVNSGTSQKEVVSLRYGSKGTDVLTLQNRLITLGYLSGSADGAFGAATQDAVKAFQNANGLTADGVVGAKTREVLFSSSAKKNEVSTSTTLKLGMVSDAVRDMQNRLIALGYLTGKADGIFGANTSLALIAFQKNNGLNADGIAGTKSLEKLNAINAKTASGTVTTTKTADAPVISTIPASSVRYAYWYSEMRAKCKQYPNVTVYDYSTGISWRLNMFSFGAHADCEPITAEDTAAMNRAFGKTTWTPKPVWVVFSDGTVYLATTHNTPHGVQHNRSNQFSGHLCLHFPRTEAQVTSIGTYATSHQKAVDDAWIVTQRLAGK